MKIPKVWLILFGVLWSLLVVVFDLFSSSALVDQLRSTRFATAPGRIVSSEVVDTSGARSRVENLRPKIGYEYRVGEKLYTSSVVRFGPLTSSEGDSARQTVAAFPAGATRPVRYDPKEPANAVLVAGLDSSLVFLVVFLGPFNAVMIALWASALTALLPAPRCGGARVHAEAGKIFVRFGDMTAGAVALATYGFASGVATFAVGLSLGFSPPLRVALAALTVVLAAAGAMFVRQRVKNARSAPDLIIDSVRGLLTRQERPYFRSLAFAAWRQRPGYTEHPLVIRLEYIRAIEVRAPPPDDNDSQDYVVELVTDGGVGMAPKKHELGTWYLAKRAEAYAAWLRTTLALKQSMAGAPRKR